MYRIKLALIIGGAMLAFIGYEEQSVSKGTTAEPAAIDLAAIEAGTADTSNAHLQIGAHYPVYPELIYYGEQGSDKIDYAYYPILSPSHPFTVAINGLLDQHPEGVPDGQIPEIGTCAVLVKTKRFKTAAGIPDNFEPLDSVQGLVVNKVETLKDEELNLLKKSFPSFDQSKVLLLEEGRHPASAGKKFGMMGGGGLLTLLGLGWLCAGFAKN